MRILFDWCHQFPDMDDDHTRLGVGWYRHFKGHKWFGFTIYFRLIFWTTSFTYVSNFKEYDKRMNARFTGIKKREKK